VIRRIVIALILSVASIVATAQDQDLKPILYDPDTLEIVKPNAVALAQSNIFLQANSVAITNVIITANAKTNTIIVVGGQITSWVVTQ
jgi:hypothetical protein